MKPYRLLPFILSAQLLFTLPAVAADKNAPQTPEEAADELTDISENLKVLNDFAERIDMGRLMVLQRKVSDAKTSLEKNGMANMQTLSSYQDLVLTFRYSEAFLKSISTQCSQPVISKIKGEVDNIIVSRGFDKSMSSSFVANFLNQVYNLTQQLQSQSVSDSLTSWMKSSLNTKLANALASARTNGDVPATYASANEVYGMITSKYSEFYTINSKSKAYDMVTEMMGLMELYKELASRGQTSKAEGN